MRRLEAEGSLKQVKGRWHLTPDIDYPAQGVNIRSASRRNYQVVLEGSGRVIETVDEGTAFSQAHPGAVYLHQGESFLVTELDMHAALVFVRPTDVDYYTQTNHVHRSPHCAGGRGETVCGGGCVSGVGGGVQHHMGIQEKEKDNGRVPGRGDPGPAVPDLSHPGPVVRHPDMGPRPDNEGARRLSWRPPRSGARRYRTAAHVRHV